MAIYLWGDLMGIQFLIPPVIGGVIGYITNDIAIKMLFHPRKPIYIGRWKLPLTPGLIPKEKERVAKSIGKMVSTQLLDADTLERVFVSDEMIQKIQNGLEELVEKNRTNQETVEDAVLKLIPQDTANRIENDIKNDIAELIHGKLTSFGFGENITKSVLIKLKDKLNGIAFGFLSGNVGDGLIDSLSKSIGETIDKLIAENSKDIISDLIGTEIDKIKANTVSGIIEKYNDKIPNLINFVISVYKKIITENLAGILANVNLAKIIEDKISSFDVAELETLLMELMKKELKAIVYLGALLGFIMGWLNLLIPGM